MQPRRGRGVTQLPGIEIRLGLAPGQRAEAAALYWQAFGGKLGRVMGPEARALDYLARVMRGDQALCALAPDGALLGLAGFATRAGAFAHGNRHDFATVYGRFGAAWRTALWRLLESDPPPAAFQMEGLCVRDDARGRGVGRALVEAICAEAGRRGHGAVSLEVSDTNRRARVLYERAGFTVTGETRLGPLSALFGYRGSVRMERQI